MDKEKKYIGSAIVRATAQEQEGVPGYLVEQLGVHPYWMPADVFEKIYRDVETLRHNLTFGDATHFLKLGYPLARRGWNGLCKYVSYLPGSHGIDGAYINPGFISKNADGSVSYWTPGVDDVLAEDWHLLGEIVE